MARLIAVTKLNSKKLLHRGRHKTWYVSGNDDGSLVVDPSLAVAPENAFSTPIRGCKWKCDKCGRAWPAFSLTHSVAKMGKLTGIISGGTQLCPPVGCDADGCPICLGTGGRHVSKSKLKKILAERSTPKPTPTLIPDWKPTLSPGECSVEVRWLNYEKKEVSEQYIVKNRYDLDKVMNHRWFFPVSKSLYAFRSEDLHRHKVRWAVRNHDGAFIKFKELEELFPITKEYREKKQEELGLLDSDPVLRPRIIVKPKQDIESRKAIEIFLENCDYEIDHTGRVAVIKKSPHQDAFYQRIKDLEASGVNANVVTLFHGTAPQNLNPIVSNGFKLPKSDRSDTSLAFGDGCYFGKWEKAISYARTSSLSEVVGRSRKNHIISPATGKYLSLSKDYEEIDRRSMRRREKRLRREYAANEWLADYLENSRFIIECDIILGNVYLPEEITHQSAMAAVVNSNGKYQSCHYHGTFANAEWIVYDPQQVFIRKVHFYKDPPPVERDWTDTELSVGYNIGMIARNRIQKGKGDRKLKKAFNAMMNVPTDDTVAVLAQELAIDELTKQVATNAVIANPDLYTDEMKQSLFTDDPLPLQ